MAKRIVDEEMRFSIVVNGDPAQKELHQTQKSTKDLIDTNKKLRTEKRRLERQNKTETARYKEVTAEINKNTKTIQSNNARMNQLEEQIGVTGLTMAQLSKRARELRLAIRNSVPKDPGTQRLKKQLAEVNAEMRKVNATSKGMRASIGGVADKFNRFAALGASVIAGLTGVVFSIQKFIDFNSELADAQSNVQKTTGLTKDEVDDLAKSFGAFKTRSSRIELLKLAEEAGRLGIKGVKDIREFTKTADEMNVALGDELSPEQIREVGKATKIFKVGERNGRDFAEAMQSLGSSINEVAASGANNADFLVDFLKRTAGIGDIAKITAQDIVGLAATFDELGQSREISATAVNKTLISMGENVEKFANVAGVEVAEFSRLLEEDANEALIKFLEGLNEGNPGLETMAQRLKGIEVGGTRGVQAISALAGNVDLLRKRQELANKALEENTSLTAEFNLKNQNFAAIIDRIKKAFNGFMVGLKAPLESIIRGFADLFGIVDDANEAFAKQNEQTFRAAQNNRALARESSKLLARYEELTKDGIEPTTAQKEELEIITLKLKDRLGESVLMIDEETGAFKLNTEAVKEQIKIKRLQADEEASTLASRLQGAKDAIKARKEEQKIAQREVELRLKNFRKLNPDGGAGVLQSSSNRVNASTQSFDNLPGVKELNNARKRLAEINSDLNEKIKNRDDLINKLEQLNFTPEDVDAFFNPNVGEDGPKEGDTRTIGDISFVYKNGKWQRVRTTQNGEDSTNSEQQLANRLLEITRSTEDAKLQAMQDGLQKQLALEDTRHQRVIEDLQAQLSTQKQIDQLIKEGKTEQANVLIEQNKELNANIEAQEKIHQRNRAQILEDGVEDQLQQMATEFERKRIAREQQHLKELAAMGQNQEAKEQKIKAFKKQEQKIEKQHLQDTMKVLNQALNSLNFKGFDISILSDEQLANLKAKLQELGLSLAQINNLLNQIQGNDPESDVFINSVDILGFTPEQWEQTFTNLEGLKGQLRAVGMLVGAAGQLYSLFTQNRAAQEQQEFDEFMRRQEAKRQALDRRLENGLISERQHRDKEKALEKEEQKRRAELEFKQAKRQKEMLLAQTISQVAFGVASALPDLVLAAIVGSLGAIQIAQVASQPLPARGFEKGFLGGKFPVEREQDGKLFNAGFGGLSSSGIVDSPTVFLAGEQGKTAPEMIISGEDYANFAPDFKQSLSREIARVKGFEDGFNVSGSANSAQNQDKEFISVMKDVKILLKILADEGITANVIANERNARELDEALEKFKKRKQSAQL